MSGVGKLLIALSSYFVVITLFLACQADQVVPKFGRVSGLVISTMSEKDISLLFDSIDLQIPNERNHLLIMQQRMSGWANLNVFSFVVGKKNGQIKYVPIISRLFVGDGTCPDYERTCSYATRITQNEMRIGNPFNLLPHSSSFSNEEARNMDVSSRGLFYGTYRCDKDRYSQISSCPDDGNVVIFSEEFVDEYAFDISLAVFDHSDLDRLQRVTSTTIQIKERIKTVYDDKVDELFIRDSVDCSLNNDLYFDCNLSVLLSEMSALSITFESLLDELNTNLEVD